MLKPASRSVGLGWVTWHTFRHTCASLLFDQGRNVKQVQGWLGHADPSYTLRTYVHLMDEGIGDASFMDAVVTPVQPIPRRSPRLDQSGRVGTRICVRHLAGWP